MRAVLKIVGLLAISIGLFSILMDYLPIDLTPFLASFLGVHYVKVVPAENGLIHFFPISLMVIGISFISLGKLISGRKSDL